MKFLKFHIQISVIKSTTNDLSKTLFCIKIGQQMAKISSKEGRQTTKKIEKHAKIQKNHGFLTDFLFDFIELYNVFQPYFDDISAIC
jgi:hypothetical protein